MKLLSRKDVAPSAKKLHQSMKVGFIYQKSLGIKSAITVPFISSLYGHLNYPLSPVSGRKTNKLQDYINKYRIIIMGGYPISITDILRPGATLKTQVYQDFVYDLIAAERYIRNFFSAV